MQRAVSPKVEQIARGVAVLLIFLTVPFIIVWNLVLRAIAPNYTAAQSAARRRRLDEIRSWQHQQLNGLRAKRFSELSALPEQTALEAPPQFRRERFAILRTPGENGGVEIGVAHFMRTMGVILGRITPSFEMLPDGTVIEPNCEPDD